MFYLRWFALVAGVIVVGAVAFQTTFGDAPDNAWQQVLIGLVIGGSGLYGLIRGDSDD